MKRFTGKQGLISLAAGAAAGVVTGIFPLLLMIFPALLGFIGAAWGYGALGIACAAACGIIFGQTSTLTIAACSGYAAMLLSQSFIIAWAFKNRRAYRSAVAGCAIAAALCQYCATCLIPLIELGDPFAYYTQYAAYFAEAAAQSSAELGLEQAAVDQLSYITALMKRSAPDMAVLSMAGSSMLAALFNVTMAKKLCKRFKVSTKAMAPMHKWQLSRSFCQGSLILVLGALIISFTSLKNASAIMIALSMVAIGPYALMGLCLMVFSVKMRRKGRGFMIVCLVMMVILLPFSLYGLCMLGLADRLFGIRRAITRAKP